MSAGPPSGRLDWLARRFGENVVNIAAHVAYGLILALFLQAMRDQDRRPASTPERYATRVG
jgi:hypothetical protein